MIRFLLDTNVISEPLLARPDRKVLEKLRRFSGVVATASLVWHELSFGARRLPPSRRRERLLAYLAEVVAGLPILPYDQAAAAWHAEERARLERRGTVLGYADGQVAAVARANGLVLVTRNLKHFSPLEGLEVVSWHAA